MLEYYDGYGVEFESDHFVCVWNDTLNRHFLYHKGTGEEFAMSQVGVEYCIRYALNAETGVWSVL